MGAKSRHTLCASCSAVLAALRLDDDSWRARILIILLRLTCQGLPKGFTHFLFPEARNEGCSVWLPRADCLSSLQVVAKVQDLDAGLFEGAYAKRERSPK